MRHEVFLGLIYVYKNEEYIMTQSATQAYNIVALGSPLGDRLDRGANGTLSLMGEEDGIKYLLKETRPGENPQLLPNELSMLRLLNEAGAQVPVLHPDYQDDGWGRPEDIAMLLLNNAATLGDYCEAFLASQISLGNFKEVVLASLEAVDTVHQAEVIHNDLHGNNIVITLEKGLFKAYVIDFGWSFLQEDGIPAWMEYERSWWAEEPEDDLWYLRRSLEGLLSSPEGDEDYLEVIAYLDR